MSDKRARILFCSLIALGIGIGAASAFWAGCRLRVALAAQRREIVALSSDIGGASDDLRGEVQKLADGAAIMDQKVDELARVLREKRRNREGATP